MKSLHCPDSTDDKRLNKSLAFCFCFNFTQSSCHNTATGYLPRSEICNSYYIHDVYIIHFV